MNYEPLDTWKKGKIHYHTVDEIVVAELETIKTEILDKCPNTMSRQICYNIIDKRIDELKGSKKE